jgi:Flp pilus assembly pilin Flp
VSQFLRDRSGVTAVEYGVIVLFMTVAIIGAVATLGNTALNQLFLKVSESL